MIGFTAPHFSAAEAGAEILENGGTAIEAMVAAAASIAVVYPHMNGLGGDGFWLISEPGKAPVAIDASGTAAAGATAQFYTGETTIPSRGGKAALTMAGAVSGWQQALAYSSAWQTNMPLSALFNRAIEQASTGFKVTQSLQDASEKTFADFANFSNFAQFRTNNQILQKGNVLTLPKLADTLDYLAKHGLNQFYRGDIAATLATTLAAAGSPVGLHDFEQYSAQMVSPLTVNFSKGQLYNLPAPTQGIASLIILALYDRLQSDSMSEAEHSHLLIEATKQAFIVRNQYLTDPSRLKRPLSDFLIDAMLDEMAANIDLNNALDWPHDAKHGDTIWMGACDSQGRMVSYIQSLYWEFGSGIVCPETGIVWNNRGTSFSLEDNHHRLKPGLKPFHTLNPAYAELNDGRRIVYGTMGGEGQPQTQAMMLSRYLYQGFNLPDALAHPRWLLGRTWGDVSHNLKIELSMTSDVTQHLMSRGHDIVQVPANAEMMGHAGAISLIPDAPLQVATDPRSDGKAISY